MARAHRASGAANVRSLGLRCPTVDFAMGSRMSREVHVRFCEGLGVRFPRATLLTNQASVVVGSGSQFLVTGNFTQTSGFTLANGLIDPTGIFDLVDGGLGGSGTIAANVTSGGLIAPGDSAGTLAVAGDLTMTSAAALAFEIGGLIQGTKYDFLPVSGSASLDGDLEFSFFDGGQNLIGDTDALEVLGATIITGSFFNVASGDRLLASDGKGSFIVNYGSGSPFNPGSVILSNFMLIPEPRVYGMILAVCSLSGCRDPPPLRSYR